LRRGAHDANRPETLPPVPNDERVIPRPGDIFPESRNRLPLIQREQLDEDGRKLYDALTSDPNSLAGLQGPGGIKLHSPRLYAIGRGVNRYLRFESGLDRRLSELVILVAAREMESTFEWHAHEAEAQRIGIEQHIIDTIRKRRPLGKQIAERERALIKLGREAIRKHRVRRKTFAAALAFFGSEQLVNLVALMGEYASTAILLTVFDQQIP
jgi:4-carboxymuconolactone decarboxylase